jgi:hypothetical protein
MNIPNQHTPGPWRITDHGRIPETAAAILREIYDCETYDFERIHDGEFRARAARILEELEVASRAIAQVKGDK